MFRRKYLWNLFEMIKLKINFLVISSQLKTVRIELSQTENKGKQSQNKPLLNNWSYFLVIKKKITNWIWQTLPNRRWVVPIQLWTTVEELLRNKSHRLLTTLLCLCFFFKLEIITTTLATTTKVQTTENGKFRIKLQNLVVLLCNNNQ